MPGPQQQPPRPLPPNPSANANANANVNGRRTLAGRISALSTSLRMHSPRTTQEGAGDDRAGDDERGAWAETSTLVDASTSPSRGYLTGRGGLGNFHADGRPAPSAPDSEAQEQDIPWPRGRSREPRRGSNSTGRGGYGNIASGRNAHATGGWSYSAQEQEVLRAHAEARRLAIPIGRGGYGNIAHARALEAAAVRSQSVDPVAAPTSLPFSVRLPVRLTGARARARRRGSPSFSLSGADESDSDDSEKSAR